jgi:hypothetical protein
VDGAAEAYIHTSVMLWIAVFREKSVDEQN